MKHTIQQLIGIRWIIPGSIGHERTHFSNYYTEKNSIQQLLYRKELISATIESLILNPAVQMVPAHGLRNAQGQEQ